MREMGDDWLYNRRWACTIERRSTLEGMVAACTSDRQGRQTQRELIDEQRGWSSQLPEVI